MTNFNEIVFVNFFHNGDIHLSREFINQIKYKFPQYSYGYAHKNHHYIINDLDIKYYDTSSLPIQSASFGNFIDNNKLYLNTWYGSYNQKYNMSYGIVFDVLYNIFNYNTKTFLNTDLSELQSNPSKFFPKINYSRYKIDKIDQYMESIKGKYCKKILISNGVGLSGQGTNFSLTDTITYLASKFTTDLFIYTNQDTLLKPLHNTIYSKDIIGYPLVCDLNENSYISNFCDIIVGRSSGVYTFAMTQYNMFDNKKLMISYSDIGNDDGGYWLGPEMAPKIKYTSRVANYPVSNTIGAVKAFEKEIKNYFKY